MEQVRDGRVFARLAGICVAGKQAGKLGLVHRQQELVRNLELVGCKMVQVWSRLGAFRKKVVHHIWLESAQNGFRHRQDFGCLFQVHLSLRMLGILCRQRRSPLVGKCRSHLCIRKTPLRCRSHHFPLFGSEWNHIRL